MRLPFRCQAFHYECAALRPGGRHGRHRHLRPGHQQERSRKTLLLAAIVTTGLGAQNATPPKTNLKIGDMAPDFTLRATNGQTVKLSDFRGKKTVVLGGAGIFSRRFQRWLNA